MPTLRLPILFARAGDLTSQRGKNVQVVGPSVLLVQVAFQEDAFIYKHYISNCPIETTSSKCL